jgi:hypothetical protein
MSDLLNKTAVSRETKGAGELLENLLATPGLQMAATYTATAAPSGAKPKGTGAGDHLIEPR